MEAGNKYLQQEGMLFELYFLISTEVIPAEEHLISALQILYIHFCEEMAAIP
jgi:hypothetical protein